MLFSISSLQRIILMIIKFTSEEANIVDIVPRKRLEVVGKKTDLSPNYLRPEELAPVVMFTSHDPWAC